MVLEEYIPFHGFRILHKGQVLGLYNHKECNTFTSEIYRLIT